MASAYYFFSVNLASTAICQLLGYLLKFPKLPKSENLIGPRKSLQFPWDNLLQWTRQEHHLACSLLWGVQGRNLSEETVGTASISGNSLFSLPVFIETLPSLVSAPHPLQPVYPCHLKKKNLSCMNYLLLSFLSFFLYFLYFKSLHLLLWKYCLHFGVKKIYGSSFSNIRNFQFKQQGSTSKLLLNTVIYLFSLFFKNNYLIW